MLLLSMDHDYLVLCNPASCEYGRFHMLAGFVPLGMCSHSPTGMYRLLMYQVSFGLSPNVKGDSYVFVLGSDQPPRHIGCPDVHEMILALPILFRGALHWHKEQHDSGISKILVFDTIAESFQYIHPPTVPGCANIFEMDGMLGMSRFNHAATTIDIWMMQDYVSEVWAIKYQVKLPVPELTLKFGSFNKQRGVVACFWDGDLQVLVKFGDWLLQVDVDGKLVASFHCKLIDYTQFCLKGSLVPHTFFPTLERYVVNASPFI
ncbi:hypothetical protein CFC21_042759 [Triticum aestivum]|uniref:F-box associated beta-propeller type 3 domain-containing protein n=2 Tax=Triticum aestivum TaxID=4565 RepID=A0A3B6FW60_WHEAT|nr:hypothetical protein CFC21_042759 [Triticum aestivum]